MITTLNFQKELDFLKINPQYQRIIGIDEVGRGCIAGPVSVGAFVFDLDHILLENVIDSKKLTSKKREEVCSKVDSQKFYITQRSNEQIDQNGIARQIENCIDEIISIYDDGQTYFCIDGMFKKDFGRNSKKVIKGDLNFYCIALASIVAKVSRDRLMREYSLEYKTYGFERHKGYGTKMHYQKLNEFGPCPLHRKSFIKV